MHVCGVLPEHCFAPEVQTFVHVVTQLPPEQTWPPEHVAPLVHAVHPEDWSVHVCGVPAAHCLAPSEHAFVHVPAHAPAEHPDGQFTFPPQSRQPSPS